MNFRIEYYAQLRDEAGCSSETLESAATTPAELYIELDSQHGFSLQQSQLKVAINDSFAEWTSNLSDGDLIVFMPPMAGG